MTDIDKEKAAFITAYRLWCYDSHPNAHPEMVQSMAESHWGRAAGAMWLARASAAPAVQAVGEPRTMTSESNNALCALARYWRLDGDWMTCKGCKRSLIASRDGELLNHADGCKNWDQNHPWWQLRSILLGLPTPTIQPPPSAEPAPADPRPVVGIVDERHLRPTNGGEG